MVDYKYCTWTDCAVQVSVAVLLDNFVTVSMRMESEEKQQASRYQIHIILYYIIYIIYIIYIYII